MSEDELHELARRRIDRKNKRWILWGVNIFAFLIFFGAFAALGGAIPIGIGLFITIVWVGVLILHGVALGITQGRDEEIEQETTRLRDMIYEKPKRDSSRLELGEDGEVMEIIDDTQAHIKRS